MVALVVSVTSDSLAFLNGCFDRIISLVFIHLNSLLFKKIELLLSAWHCVRNRDIKIISVINDR